MTDWLRVLASRVVPSGGASGNGRKGCGFHAIEMSNDETMVPGSGRRCLRYVQMFLASAA
jgi:hypothetical protein